MHTPAILQCSQPCCLWEADWRTSTHNTYQTDKRLTISCSLYRFSLIWRHVGPSSCPLPWKRTPGGAESPQETKETDRPPTCAAGRGASRYGWASRGPLPESAGVPCAVLRQHAPPKAVRRPPIEYINEGEPETGLADAARTLSATEKRRRRAKRRSDMRNDVPTSARYKRSSSRTRVHTSSLRRSVRKSSYFKSLRKRGENRCEPPPAATSRRRG